MPNESKKTERRGKWRFVIERDVRYRLLDREDIAASGCGRTIDISSSGVAFLGEHSLPAGAFIELSLSWPVLLNDDTPMRLVIFGRVVRSSTFTNACTIDKYEFRTQARRSLESPTPIRKDAMLRRWAEQMRSKPAFEALASA